MKKSIPFLLGLLLVLGLQCAWAQEKTFTPDESFDKIIVSPHIEAVFVKGNSSKIEVDENEHWVGRGFDA